MQFRWDMKKKQQKEMSKSFSRYTCIKIFVNENSSYKKK